MSLEAAAIVGEVLSLALKLGEATYKAVHAAIVETRPELVPATLPERSDEAIKSSTEALIRERFHRKSEAPPNTSER